MASLLAQVWNTFGPPTHYPPTIPCLEPAVGRNLHFLSSNGCASRGLCWGSNWKLTRLFGVANAINLPHGGPVLICAKHKVTPAHVQGVSDFDACHFPSQLNIPWGRFRLRSRQIFGPAVEPCQRKRSSRAGPCPYPGSRPNRSLGSRTCWIKTCKGPGCLVIPSHLPKKERNATCQRSGTTEQLLSLKDMQEVLNLFPEACITCGR